MSTYTLDTNLAKSADGGGYINQTGKYIGRILVAKEVISKKDTKGIEFSFQSNSGQIANYLTVWTVNNKGEQLSGLKVINAMMTCMQVRQMSPHPFMIKTKDKQEMAQCFVELHKPIGLLLAREAYDKGDNTEGFRFVIEGVFDPNTELTASEILERKTVPTKLGEMVARLKDRPKQSNIAYGNQGNQGYQSQPQYQNQAQQSQGVAGLDDDVPF